MQKNVYNSVHWRKTYGLSSDSNLQCFPRWSSSYWSQSRSSQKSRFQFNFD